MDGWGECGVGHCLEEQVGEEDGGGEAGGVWGCEGVGEGWVGWLLAWLRLMWMMEM